MTLSDNRIKTIPEKNIILKEIVHVCIVVKNVEKTAQTFSEKFGIGPWEIREKYYPKSKAFIHGKPTEYTLKFGYTKIGQITLELVETLSGETIYQEFLEKHGEGIHHIGIPTPLPLKDELKKWKDQGIQPLQISNLEDPEEGWAYMDTQNMVGCILEILSFKKFQ